MKHLSAGVLLIPKCGHPCVRGWRTWGADFRAWSVSRRPARRDTGADVDDPDEDEVCLSARTQAARA